MVFSPDQIVKLPELANRLGLSSEEFRVDCILKGGMGECIRIVQGEESFALKVIQRNFVEDPDEWNRYLREVQIWQTLSACDGVVEALCSIRVNEIPMVCSRWMQGGDLRRHLRNRSPEFFFSVMARIVGTLAWAHQQHQVIHRDLKPDNILLDEANLAFVSDWGLARPLTVPPPQANGRATIASPGVAHPALTVAGSFLGTVSYASPEQLMGNAALDHRTDIYSLGCLMHEWEAGGCPFTGTTAEEIALKQLFEAPPPLASFFRRTAFGAEDLIRQCLEKDPKKRLSDYGSLDRALAEAAKIRNIHYESFSPGIRYSMPMVGARTLGDYDFESALKGHAGTHQLVPFSEVEQFIREAEALTAVGDYQKAEEIYSLLFVPESVKDVPDDPTNQCITISYAFCLTALGRAAEAIEVLDHLSGAQEKPAGYFVNLSHAQLRRANYRGAASTAVYGLRQYPDDQDLVGNLLIAQSSLGAFAEAAATAQVRLSHNRHVHSLEEVAALHRKYADSILELDWPVAVKNLKYAVKLLREAKELNPRYLPVRMLLPMTLEVMTAYTQCSSELDAAKQLPLNDSDLVFFAYLSARCLDRVGGHKACLKFCDGWLKRIAEVEATNPIPKLNVVRLERVRAITIADGFAIGRMTDGGKRIVVPEAEEFFANIVNDEKMREPGDFCYLARFHEWVAEYEEATVVLDEAESLYPKYWEIPFQRAQFHIRAGDYDGAYTPADQATQLAPWRSQTWELLARVNKGLGRSAEALIAKERATEVQRLRDQLAEEIDLA